LLEVCFKLGLASNAFVPKPSSPKLRGSSRSFPKLAPKPSPPLPKASKGSELLSTLDDAGLCSFLLEGAFPNTSLDEAGLCSFLLEEGAIPKPSFPKLACPNAESSNPLSPNPVLVLPNSNPFPKSLLNSMAGPLPLPDEFPKADVVSLTDWSGVLDEANVKLSS
jgi:hypothetical protein